MNRQETVRCELALRSCEEQHSGEHDISLQYDQCQGAQGAHSLYEAALGHFALQGHTEYNQTVNRNSLSLNI